MSAVSIEEILKDPRINKYTGRLQSYHSDTDIHSQRVSLDVYDIAKSSGLSEQVIIDATKAARLHDMGKLKIPRRILDKPGPLNHWEWLFMEGHAFFAYWVLKDFRDERTATMAMNHHRPSHEANWVRKKFQRRIEDPEVLAAIEIISVCDMYDAMSHDRVYRKAMRPEQIEYYLKKQFRGNPEYIKQVMEKNSPLSN